MNLLDIIIIATMAFLVVKGLFRGFIREIASLAGIALGIWLGIHFLPQVTGYLRTYLPSTRYLQVISFAAILFLVLISCNLLGWMLKLLFKKASLGWIDRTMGAVLALTKGVIITYLVIWLLILYVPSTSPLIAKSKLVPVIKDSYQSIIRLISPEHYQNLKKRIMQKKKEMGEIT